MLRRRCVSMRQLLLHSDWQAMRWYWWLRRRKWRVVLRRYRLYRPILLLRLGRSCHQMFSAVLLVSPQYLHREPTNQVSHFEGGTGDRKLYVIGRLLLCSASAVRRGHHKPHLCIVERNSSTPVRMRFSLTQEGLGRVIPSGGAGQWWNKCVEAKSIFLPFLVFKLETDRFHFFETDTNIFKKLFTDNWPVTGILLTTDTEFQNLLTDIFSDILT